MNAKGKAKPYWLLGGVIGAALVLVIFGANYLGALIYNTVEPPSSIFSSEYPLMFPFLLFSLPVAEPASWLSDLAAFLIPSLKGSHFLEYACLLFLDCLFLFLMGALVGLAVGAVKGVPRGSRGASPRSES